MEQESKTAAVAAGEDENTSKDEESSIAIAHIDSDEKDASKHGKDKHRSDDELEKHSKSSKHKKHKHHKHHSKHHRKHSKHHKHRSEHRDRDGESKSKRERSKSPENETNNDVEGQKKVRLDSTTDDIPSIDSIEELERIKQKLERELKSAEIAPEVTDKTVDKKEETKSPLKQTSTSPRRRRSKSRSPARKHRSRSPRRRSRSPRRRRSRSRSPRRRQRTRSPPSRRRRSRSPRRRSRSPATRRRSRSPRYSRDNRRSPSSRKSYTDTLEELAGRDVDSKTTRDGKNVSNHGRRSDNSRRSDRRQEQEMTSNGNSNGKSSESKSERRERKSSEDKTEDIVLGNDSDIDDEEALEKKRQQRRALLAKFSSTATASPIPNPPQNAQDTPDIGSSSPFTVLSPPINPAAVSTILDEEIDNEEDMFSKAFDAENLEATVQTAKVKDDKGHLKDNWTDAEGYYRLRIGEMLDNRYEVFGFTGQGMFSNVVRARDTKKNHEAVAIKIIRQNDLMYKAALKELEVLKKLNEADPKGKYRCVQLLRHFKHKGHMCMVFENLSLNLRELIKKYGKNEGLSIKAVRAYAQQLMYALKLMRKIKVVHADVKPDNILVSENKQMLKLCDFGSAAMVGECEITPYLVSRFYRAPEIMFGHPYSYEIDMWSIGCTLFELYTGNILFRGRSNNDMLKSILELRGKPSGKYLRKGQFYQQHFDDEGNFLYVETDKVTQQVKLTEMKMTKPEKDLATLLHRDFKMTDFEKRKHTQFKDFLEKTLMVDPSKRITPSEALQHPFIVDRS